MYEEVEYKFDWSSVIFKLLFIILAFILILVFIFIFSNKNVKQNNYFEDNFNTMVSVAKNYYNSDDNNQDILTLEEMINRKMIIDFIDEDGKNCDIENSYAKLNGNKITIQLICSKNEDKRDVSI